jgi:hypothetical protein
MTSPCACCQIYPIIVPLKSSLAVLHTVPVSSSGSTLCSMPCVPRACKTNRWWLQPHSNLQPQRLSVLDYHMTQLHSSVRTVTLHMQITSCRRRTQDSVPRRHLKANRQLPGYMHRDAYAFRFQPIFPPCPHLPSLPKASLCPCISQCSSMLLQRAPCLPSRNLHTRALVRCP